MNVQTGWCQAQSRRTEQCKGSACVNVEAEVPTHSISDCFEAVDVKCGLKVNDQNTLHILFTGQPLMTLIACLGQQAEAVSHLE